MQVMHQNSRHPLRAGIALALGLFAALASALPQPAGAAETYRHRTADGSSPTASLGRWHGVLARLDSERPAVDACQAEGGCQGPAVRFWLDNLDRYAQLAPKARIVAVNRLINRWPYASDADTYGAPDHWATPVQFLERGGDCEDYAIAKYESLRRLGVPAADMRVVVVNDMAESRAHAILLVAQEGRWLVLDNQTADPMPLDRVSRYEPLAAMNEVAVWRYGPVMEIPVPAWGRNDTPRRGR